MAAAFALQGMLLGGSWDLVSKAISTFLGDIYIYMYIYIIMGITSYLS